MQRLGLILFASLGMLGCNDSTPASPADLSPEYAKGGGGAVPGITVTSIGPPTGGSSAEEVNDQGLIVGNTGSPSRAFLWTPSQPRGTSGTLQDLGAVGGVASQATAINNSGHVVGSTGIGPFLWTRTGGMQGLGLASGWSSANAQDINETGQVAGIAETEVGQRAAVWTVSVDAGGVVQVLSRESLGTLPGGGNSVAFALNNVGQVVGYAYPAASGPNHAVIWTQTPSGWMVEDLGMVVGDRGSTAMGINDQGQVAGWSIPAQGCNHAVVWTTQGGKVTGLRALETSGGCSAQAWAINNQGQIVGRLTSKSGQNATMWSLAPDGSTASIKDLGRLSGTGGSLGVGLSSSVGGVTEVVGFSQGTTSRATLWTVR